MSQIYKLFSLLIIILFSIYNSYSLLDTAIDETIESGFNFIDFFASFLIDFITGNILILIVLSSLISLVAFLIFLVGQKLKNMIPTHKIK